MMEAENTEIELATKKEAEAVDAWSFESSVPPSALNFEEQFPRHAPYHGICVWYDRSYWSNYRAEDNAATICADNGPRKSQRELQNSRERWPLFDAFFTTKCY